MTTAPTYPHIGSALRCYRERAGLPREQVGVALARSVTAIHRWEKNDRVPKLPLLGQLAELYGVTAVELLTAAITPPAGGDRRP